MIGANAAGTAKVAPGTAKAAHGVGHATDMRPGLPERLIRRYRAHVARTHAEQLARMTWTERTPHSSAGPGRESRDGGATPLRWIRLT